MTNFENSNILIIDGDIDYCNRLCEYLKKNSFKNIEILQDCGRFAERVRYLKPIAVVMDIVLPGADGLQFLKQLGLMKKEGIDARAIVASAFYNERYLREASQLGAYSYMIKPVSFDNIVNKINEIKLSYDISSARAFLCDATENTENTGYAVKEAAVMEPTRQIEYDEATKRMRTMVKITKLLHDMGIPAHLCGHDYLRDAIIMVMESHEVSGRMTKEIYPEIANKYKKSPQSVERAIRTALDVAWTRGKTELINDIFRFTVNIQKGRPTNSEFVSLIADYLNYDYAGVV